MKSLKALITKNNISSVKINHHTTYKKSMLKTGDIVVFECGNAGIFCKYADVNPERYGLTSMGDDYILIYLLAGEIRLFTTNKSNLSEDLKSKITKGLNIIKVIPKVFDVADMRNVEKINRFFTTEEYKKYL